MVIAGVLIVIIAFKLFDVIRLKVWSANPSKEGQLIDVGGYKLFSRVKGKGEMPVVILTSLGTTSFEWWGIQDEVAHQAPCLTYDRSGYGWSEKTDLPRTSQNVAMELKALLDGLGLKPPFLLAGHSAGALFARHFACLYPELVAGCVFIDPMSPDDLRFKEELPRNVYESSGADKSSFIRRMVMLSNIGMLRLMRPMFLKSWLWQYYKDFSPNIRNDIFEHYMKAASNSLILGEYKEAHKKVNRDLVMSLSPKFPHVPIKVIYHTPARMIEETKEYGHLTHQEALQVEELWHELAHEYRDLSPKSEWVEAEDANHFIHLDEKTLVIKQILELWRGIGSHVKRNS